MLPPQGEGMYPGRVAYLDGLRGIAITAVMLFHAYVRWPQVVPFGDHFSGRPWVAYGWLGVQLFFMISGFVIAWTLERCESFGEFARRRWLRLFPAMAIVTLFVFGTAPLFPERPAGAPAWNDIVPGLLFIDPVWIASLTGSPQGVLEGAFWSLFVEAKFYVIAGAAYFAAGRGGMIGALVGAFALSLVAGISGLPLLREVVEITSASYFGWFACGALFYLYTREGRRAVALTALLVGMIAAASQPGYQLHPGLFAMAPVALFGACVCIPSLQRIVGSRVPVLVGFISYPLYLVHENMLAALVVKLDRFVPGLAPAVLPLAPMLLLAVVAWIVAARLEPALRDLLRVLGKTLRTDVSVAREGPNP